MAEPRRVRDGRVLSSMLAPGERHATRVVRGQGMELTLEDGRVVLDMGSLSSCIVGHCHPAVVAAVRDAAGSVYVNDTTGYGPREQATEDLLELGFAGEAWPGAAALVVSSSEAADLALLLAQMLTERAPLVCRELAYHGGVGLGRELSTHPLWGGTLVPAAAEGASTERPPIAEVRQLPLPVCGLAPVGSEHRCEDTCLAGAAELLDGAAAVMMDSSAGAVLPGGQYQDALAAAAREAGALWIADETVTAFGRLGHGFAFQRGTSRPDMVTLGKGLTGAAAPGGALVLSQDVIDAIGQRRWKTSSTFRGHPLTAAAISATLRVVRDEQLVANAAARGREIAPRMEELVERHACVRRVIGEGLMWHIELNGPQRFDEDRWRGDGTATTLPELVHREALARGVYIGVSSGQALWLIPPLIVDARQLDHAVEVLDAALTAVEER